MSIQRGAGFAHGRRRSRCGIRVQYHFGFHFNDPSHLLLFDKTNRTGQHLAIQRQHKSIHMRWDQAACRPHRETVTACYCGSSPGPTSTATEEATGFKIHTRTKIYTMEGWFRRTQCLSFVWAIYDWQWRSRWGWVEKPLGDVSPSPRWGQVTLIVFL